MSITVGAGRAPSRTRWFRLIPAAMILYIISFMDRSNIAYAFAGIGHSFHVNKAAQGAAGGVFFFGYVLLQIPGGWLAEHWSAKKFVTIMICFWGLMALACGFVQSYTQLLVFRFLLGVAEGGIWPAILVLISHWFPVRERARAYGFWMANLAIASIITQPLSGFIVHTLNWRALFYIEGSLPFLISLPVWVLLIKDYPAEASWCPPEERDYIERSIANDRKSEPPPGPFIDIFRNATVWRLVIVYFLIQIGFYGLTLWMPTLIKEMTHANFSAVGLIATLPYITAAIFLWCNGWMADRDQHYSFHVLLAVGLAAITLVASVLVGTAMLDVAIALLCAAMGGALSYDGPFWATGSRTLSLPVVGAAMGLINALGNLGGFLGPFIGGRLQDATHNFLATAIFFAGSLLLAGLLMLTVRVRDVRTIPPPMAAP